MTDPVNAAAARAPREPAEAAPLEGRQRPRRTLLTERDFAELEALLTRELQRSPSIAAAGAGYERPLHEAEPRRRQQPSARRIPPREGQPQQAGTRRGKRLDQFLHELKQLAAEESAPAIAPLAGAREFPQRAARSPEPAPRFLRPKTRAPLAPMPRDGRRSLFARAMSFAATAFSLVAIVGVSALLVMLAAGDDVPSAIAAKNAAQPGQPAAESAPVPPASAERADAEIVTGSIAAKQDASRIPSQGYTAARGGGTVWAVDAQRADAAGTPQPAEAAPAQRAFAAAAPAAGEEAPSAPAAESVFSPPPAAEVLASRGFAPPASAAAPASEEPAAQTETAAVETAAAQPADNGAEPSPAARTAPVTAHVNMRAGPENDAAVVAVVPEGRHVEVLECTRWCEVVYEGQKGFIHRRFVSGAGE